MNGDLAIQGFDRAEYGLAIEGLVATCRFLKIALGSRDLIDIDHREIEGFARGP